MIEVTKLPDANQVTDLGDALLQQFSKICTKRSNALGRAALEEWVADVRLHNEDVSGYIISFLDDPETRKELVNKARRGPFAYSVLLQVVILIPLMYLLQNCEWAVHNSLELSGGPNQGWTPICPIYIRVVMALVIFMTFALSVYGVWKDIGSTVERFVTDALCRLRACAGDEITQFPLARPAFNACEVRWNVGPFQGKYFTVVLNRTDLQSVYGHATNVAHFTEEVATCIPLTKGTAGADNYQAYIYKNRQKLGIISRVKTKHDVYYVTPAHVASEMQGSVIQRYEAGAVVFDEPDYVIEDLDVAVWVENRKTKDAASVLGWKAISVAPVTSRMEFQGYLPRSDGLWLGKSKLVPFKKWWGVWDHFISTDKGDSGLLIISPPGRQTSKAVAMHIGGQQLAEINGAVTLQYALELIEFGKEQFVEEKGHYEIVHDNESLRSGGDFSDDDFDDSDFLKEMSKFDVQFETQERKLMKRLAEKDIDHVHTVSSRDGTSFLAVTRKNKSVKRVKTTIPAEEKEETDRLIENSLLRARGKSRHRARVGNPKELIRKLPEVLKIMPLSFVEVYNREKNKSITDYAADPLYSEAEKEWKKTLSTFNPDSNAFKWDGKPVKYDQPYDRDAMRKGDIAVISSAEDFFSMGEDVIAPISEDVSAFILESGTRREGSETDQSPPEKEEPSKVEPKLPDLSTEKSVEPVNPEKERLKKESRDLMVARALSLAESLDPESEESLLQDIVDSMTDAPVAVCKSLKVLVDAKMGDLGTILGAFGERREFMERLKGCKLQYPTASQFHLDVIKKNKAYALILKKLQDKLDVPEEVATEKMNEIDQSFEKVRREIQSMLDALVYCEKRFQSGDVNALDAKLKSIQLRLSNAKELMPKFTEESSASARQDDLLDSFVDVEARVDTLLFQLKLEENCKAPVVVKSRTLCVASSAGAGNSASNSSSKGAGKSQKQKTSGTQQSRE